jgi:hypothetical protein
VVVVTVVLLVQPTRVAALALVRRQHNKIRRINNVATDQ